MIIKLVTFICVLFLEFKTGTIFKNIDTYGAKVLEETEKKTLNKFRALRKWIIGDGVVSEIRARTDLNVYVTETIETKRLIFSREQMRRMSVEKWSQNYGNAILRKRGIQRSSWSDGVPKAIENRNPQEEDWITKRETAVKARIRETVDDVDPLALIISRTVQ